MPAMSGSSPFSEVGRAGCRARSARRASFSWRLSWRARSRARLFWVGLDFCTTCTSIPAPRAMARAFRARRAGNVRETMVSRDHATWFQGHIAKPRSFCVKSRRSLRQRRLLSSMERASSANSLTGLSASRSMRRRRDNKAQVFTSNFYIAKRRNYRARARKAHATRGFPRGIACEPGLENCRVR